MEVVYQRGCGIDVHKKMIVACFRDGRKKELREFGTLTSDLRELTKVFRHKCAQFARVMFLVGKACSVLRRSRILSSSILISSFA